MVCAPTCPTGTASTGPPRCGNDIAQTTVSEPSPGADAAEPSPHIWQRWVRPIDTQAMRALERTPVVTQRLQRHGRLPREPAGPDRPERNLHVGPTRSARVVAQAHRMQRTGLAAATSASVRLCNAAQRGQRGTTVGSVPSSAVAMTDPVVLNSITQTPLHDRPCHMDCLLSERSNWRNRAWPSRASCRLRSAAAAVRCPFGQVPVVRRTARLKRSAAAPTPHCRGPSHSACRGRRRRDHRPVVPGRHLSRSTPGFVDVGERRRIRGGPRSRRLLRRITNPEAPRTALIAAG